MIRDFEFPRNLLYLVDYRGTRVLRGHHRVKGVLFPISDVFRDVLEDNRPRDDEETREEGASGTEQVKEDVFGGTTRTLYGQ